MQTARSRARTSNLRKRRRPTRQSSGPRKASFETLEERLLLSTYTFIDQGSATANAASLQAIINKTAMVDGSHYLLSGDVLKINPTSVFLFSSGGTSALTIPNRTDFAQGGAPIIIETADIAQLPSGRLDGPAYEDHLVQFRGSVANGSIIKTVAYAHDFTFIGIEVMPNDNTIAGSAPYIALGDGSSAQSTSAMVPTNFTFDRCYVHGWAGTPDQPADNLTAFKMDCARATIINNYISEMHSTFQEAKGISGTNGIGPWLIDNNYISAAAMDIFFGGANSYVDLVRDGQGNIIDGADPDNITITNNYMTTPLSWDPFIDEGFIGVNYIIKNSFELKHATNVLFDHNVMDNISTPSGQRGEAVLIRPVNQTGGTPWDIMHDITLTNNIIKYCGCGIQVATNNVTDGSGGPAGLKAQPMYNVLVQNNLMEDITAADTWGNGCAFTYGGVDPGWNVRFDHNTCINTNNALGLGGGTQPWEMPITWGFEFTNNIVCHDVSGGGAGSGLNALNTICSGVVMTNEGSGYTSAPGVTFSPPASGTTATGTAIIYNGKVINVKITDPGSGYTTAPTITFNNSGSGGTGAAATCNLTDGMVKAWKFDRNVLIGQSSTGYPTNNKYSDVAPSVDSVSFTDPFGDDYSLMATINGGGANTLKGYATDGTDPGVNMSQLLGAPDFQRLDATLQGYWKFDDSTSGTTADDSSSYNHNGTLTGTSLWTTSGNVGDGIVPGSGKVTVSSFGTTSTFSFLTWIKPTATNAQYIVSTGSGNQAFSMYVDSTGHLKATTSNGATVTDSAALTNNTWYLVGCTYDNATKKLTLYKNGVSVGMPATGTGNIGSGSMSLYIGDNGGSSGSFVGTLDEARYYTSVLSPDQMERTYTLFSPMIDLINPGGNPIKTASSVFSITGKVFNHAGYSNLTYTWSQDSGPGTVTISNIHATNPTVTWNGAGVYYMRLTVTDTLGGYTSVFHKSNVVQMPQGTISLSPANPSVATGATKQFSIVGGTLDQFGAPFTGTWTWSATSGFITQSGLYNAPGTAGSDTVKISYQGTSYTTGVTITGSTLPTVSIVATDSSAKESTTNSTAVYTITRSTVSSSSMTVNFTISGSATLNSDYTLDRTANVVIPANVASATVTLTRLDDTIIEGNESAILTLTAGTGYAINAATATATATVIDDDLETITVTAITPNASETGPTNGVYRFVRTPTAGGYQYGSGPRTVDFVMSGTATNRVDYSVIYGWVSFAPGQQSVDVTLTPIDDAVMESDETAIVTISTNALYVVGSPSTATVTITDNDTVTIPSAPTNLVATPGTSDIDLTWTDTSDNETSFRIWRSTDNSTWGSVYATVGANVTSYSDPSPGAGVAYFYKVTSYNAAGDSSVTLGQNDITCAVATIIAYEGFNYTAGSGSNWDGQNTGLGFAGNWSLNDVAHTTIVNNSLAYSNGTHGLTTSANSVQWSVATNTASNTLSTTVGTLGSTLWFSFEYNKLTATSPNAHLNIGPATNRVWLGPSNGNIKINAVVGTNNYAADSGVNPASNTVYFIVGRIQYLATGDIIDVWVNPQPGAASPTGYLGTGTYTLPSAKQLTSTTAFSMSPGIAAACLMDEIRIGATYASVSPDPIVDDITPMQPPKRKGPPAAKASSLSSAALAYVGQQVTSSSAGGISQDFSLLEVVPSAPDDTSSETQLTPIDSGDAQQQSLTMASALDDGVLEILQPLHLGI